MSKRFWKSNIHIRLKIIDKQRSSWHAMDLLTILSLRREGSCLACCCMYEGRFEHHSWRKVAVFEFFEFLPEDRNFESSCNPQLLYILSFRGPHLFNQTRTETSTGIPSPECFNKWATARVCFLITKTQICSHKLDTLSLLNLPSILSTSSLMDRGCPFTVVSC